MKVLKDAHKFMAHNLIRINTGINTFIKKPIIFIGAPRSGTTIFFEAFSVHEDLAWFSLLLAKYPMFPIISVLSRIADFEMLRGEKSQGIKRKSVIKKILPYPDEGYSIWERHCGSEFLFTFMIDRIAEENEKKKLRMYIQKVIRYHGKKRFAMKITGPARIGYLNSLFPDAIFIHIIRDGRAVINSLMNVDFWRDGGGYEKPWWENGLTNNDMALYIKYERSPLALAAIQWRRIIKIARQEAGAISGNRYLEIRYEDFVDNYNESVKKIFEFSHLRNSKKVFRYMEYKSKIKNMNFKYKDEMNREDIEMINEIACDLLTALDYNI